MAQGTTMALARAILNSLGASSDALGTAGDELYMSLHTGDPVSGTDIVMTSVVSGGNYENELLSFSLSGTNPTDPAAGNASVLSSTAVSEAAFCTAGDGVINYSADVTHFAIHKCASAGACADSNVIVTGTLSATLSSGDKVTLNAVTISLLSVNKQV